VLESVSLGIVETEADDPGPAHDFAGVGPEGLVESMLIALVVVAAEDSIGFAGFGEAPSDLGIVVEEDFPSVCFEFRDRIIQSDMRMLFGHLTEEEPVAIVVSEDGMDRVREAGGQFCQCEWGAEVTQEEELLAATNSHLSECPCEVIQPIVNVTQDRNEHVAEHGPGRTRVNGGRPAKGFIALAGCGLAAAGSIATLNFVT
jgi:hypothetical protein